jgi:H/ACA ribonucleoprotein complex subunit 4
MSEYDIKENTKGYAFKTKRIIMAPETYPKSWKSRSTVKKNITNA